MSLPATVILAKHNIGSGYLYEPVTCPVCLGGGEVEVSWQTGRAPWMVEGAMVKCPFCLGDGEVFTDGDKDEQLVELMLLRKSGPAKAWRLASEMVHEALEGGPGRRRFRRKRGGENNG